MKLGMVGLGRLSVRSGTALAWTWYVLAGTAVCLTIGYSVSLMTRQPGEEPSLETATEVGAVSD